MPRIKLTKSAIDGLSTPVKDTVYWDSGCPGFGATVGINRASGKPVGNLSKIASTFERLLLPKMRSRKPATMVKRLQRSLERIGQKS